MGEQNIYKFLTVKCKEKSIKIEELPKLCGFSRSTLYRYMKGILYMPPEVEQKFADVLKLDDAERKQLSILASLTAFDESMIRARHALDSFMFGAKPAPAEQEVIQLAYYDDDKYLRTTQELFEKILTGSDQPQYACEVHILNCMEPKAFHCLADFLRRLLCASGSSAAEHLITLSTEDHFDNISSLLSLLPLLNYQRYQVRYKVAGQRVRRQSVLFSDCVLLSVQRESGSEYYMLSFLEDRLSDCFVTRNRFWYEFLLSNYEQLRTEYQEILCDHTAPGPQQPFSDENPAACYVMKYDLCFSCLPAAVQDALRAQVSGADKASFPPLQEWISSAAQGAYKTHVHSAAGLVRFSQTGRLEGEPKQCDTLGKDVRLRVFESLLARADAQDPSVRLLLTRDPLLESGHTILASKEGLCIVYPDTEYGNRRTPYIFVRSRELAGILADYVDSHLPTELVLSPQETIAFLGGQIAALQNPKTE